MDELRIAVVGAGIAGLACAQELLRADAHVTVFERARGIGGRIATRRVGDLAFDHGAQFATARSRGFLRYAQAAVRAGTLDAWRPRLMEDARTWPAPIDDWWIGTPGMGALVRPLARNLEIQTGVSVHELLPGQRGWELQTDSGRPHQVFRAVAIAVPAPQAATLLGPHGRAFRQIAEVRMAPCWTGLYAFDGALDLGAEARRWTRGPVAWAGCDSSKPGRFARPQCWVVHASSGWSREHLELDADEASRLLLHAFAEAVGWSRRRSACPASSTRRSEPAPAATGASRRASKPRSRAAAASLTRSCPWSGCPRACRAAERADRAASGRRRARSLRRAPRARARAPSARPRRSRGT